MLGNAGDGKCRYTGSCRPSMSEQAGTERAA
jgi:hypothetical protein